MLSEKKWKFMKNLVEVLKKFEEVTKTLGGSKYVAFSLIYSLIFKLKDLLKRH